MDNSVTLIELSVIICTHNPRKDYLERVLEGLRTQTLGVEAWELLLIDNGSTDQLVNHWDLSWHPSAQIIREDVLGLTPARLRGMRDSKADVLVFSDDDTIFAPNYLAESLRIANEWPMLGAWGGQPTPEFECPPPDWASPYLPMLGLCRTERDCWSNHYDSTACPIGAGMCLRRCVADQYCRCLASSDQRAGLDRTGNALLSGGDTDIALMAYDIGFGVGRFISLEFVHLIPIRRLTLGYLLALREGMVFSHVILDSYRPKLFQQKPMMRSMAGYIWRMLKGDRYESRFQLAAWRGEWKARQILAMKRKVSGN